MDIHDELNTDADAHPAPNRKLVTVASLLLLGGAFIATPLLRRHREAIEQTTERVTASGRDLLKNVASKLPFLSKDKEGRD